MRSRTALGTALFLTALLPAVASAQDVPIPGPVRIDSIAVEGNVRVDVQAILDRLPFQPGQEIVLRHVREATKELMGTGHFRDVEIHLLGNEPAVLLIRVDEQPLVRQVRILGLEHADPDEIRDSTGLEPNTPFSENRLVRAGRMIRDELADEGIPFAAVEHRLLPVEGQDNVVDVVLDVEEGERITVADVEIVGNENVPTEAIVGAMSTGPEGFWWFQAGSYDEEAFEEDVAASIPRLYASRGYLDFRVLSDTLIIDPNTGKARVRIEVDEGPQYRVARFSIEGNNEFTDDQLERFFRPERGGLLASLGLVGEEEREAQQRGEVFDQVALQEALADVQLAYTNRGYIWSDVQPVIEKHPPANPDADHTVSVAIRIQENKPAYVHRVAIEGNEHTHEWVIRDKIVMLPGDVFSQQRLLQSYQGIQSLGFFETPLPEPQIEQRREDGEVDITFRVIERETGSINFGTSLGGGVGLAGFVGYDEPNLFGQAKEGHLRWDFGRFINNFTVSFTDPALFRSRVSGTIALFNARDRFFSFNSGRRVRRGGSLRFGFPVPGAVRSRFFVGYSLSRTDFQVFEGTDDTSLFGREDGTQSQLSFGLLRNRLDHPIFATAGSRQELNLELNGGILGGSGEFQKLTADAQWWVPLGQAGAQMSPVRFTLGMKFNSGTIIGEADRFPFDRFWMGGVQFGEQLRGYDETSITPLGFFPENSSGIADIDRLGDTFLSVSAEVAARVSSVVSLSAFFDAGNVWRNPGDVDPTRLFRGAGFGAQMVTPFGPLGIDYAYGFDKTNPGWQLHFRMGPGF